MEKNEPFYGKTILVVDDDPDFCELIQEFLNGIHYQVLTAHDGLEAVAWTNQGHVDLILMDIHMPIFSGLWFCAAFKKKKNTRNIPIVIISGALDEVSEKKARLVGACACLKKPFSRQELLDVVKKNAP
jgi:CheY-like chemotaxis protein